jgi:hypothetical protein
MHLLVLFLVKHRCMVIKNLKLIIRDIYTYLVLQQMHTDKI